MSFWADARMAGRYLGGLREFWRAPANWRDSVGVIRGWLAQREGAFVQMMQRHVFGNPASPYLRLLEAARMTLPDVERLVREAGVDGCLRRLYEAGVYVTLDEFKGRRSIHRLGLDLAVTAGDFDAVTSETSLTAPTGGSRSRGTATPIDVADLLYELPPRYLFSQAYGLFEGDFANWRPPPPGSAGLRSALRNIKLGMTMRRWFSLTRPGFGRASGKSAVVTLCTIVGSTLMGHRITYPEYVPMERAEVVVHWLADEKAHGRFAHVDTMVSGAVRIAQAARDLGIDIAGQAVRVGGEPLTAGKAALFASVGLRYCSQYGMTEAGTLGLSCAAGSAPDDLHLLDYRLALLQEPRSLPGWPEPVGALFLTLFSPRMAKVMLNMELGDYAVMSRRECDCPLGAAGLHTHLHTLRSYEKLTSVGMHFMGADLFDLLETALPARFGGGPGDYQFVESEVGGETVLKLVVAPRLGPLNEAAVVAYVLDELDVRTKAGRMMTDIWRHSGLLRVERVEPYLTRAAKILPLHVERPQ